MNRKHYICEHTFFDKGFLERDAIIVDLGACLGEFSNEFDWNFRGVEKAILVEANPTNFAQIQKRRNFELLNRVVSSDSKGSATFNEDLSSPYNGSAIFSGFQNSQVHTIKKISLGSIIQCFGLSRIDLLKIDIEGAEYEILENITQDQCNIIDQITVEFHDFVDPSLRNRNSQIEKRMESFGYKILKNSSGYLHGSQNYDTLFYKE